jgi:transcriptional regulator with XRE-family HTH domain
MPPMSIADELRKAVKASKVTKYRLAQETGINEAQLGKWMRGMVGLSAENLDKLAAALGLKFVLVKKGKR